MLLRACVFAVTLAGPGCLAQRGFPFGATLDGRPVARLGAPGTKVVALFFVASDCPVSNRTFPEMRRLSEVFRGRGVRFWFVYPNATEKAGEIRAHQVSFDPGERDLAITDPSSALMKLAQAMVTPEAAVLIPAGAEWKVVYRGRVDDRFVRIGLERPAPTQLLAERAIEEALAGKAVTPDPGTPVGCSIVTNKVAGR